MAPTFAPSNAQDSFADMLSTVIVFVKGSLPEGDRYWAYLAMKPSMAKPFKAAQHTGNFDLEEYGTIIEWGKGNEPPKDVVEQMKQQYAVDDDNQKNLLERLCKLTES